MTRYIDVSKNPQLCRAILELAPFVECGPYASDTKYHQSHIRFITDKTQKPYLELYINKAFGKWCAYYTTKTLEERTKRDCLQVAVAGAKTPEELLEKLKTFINELGVYNQNIEMN